jgi:Mg/Co/Ni transporter MgtE
MGFRQVYEYVAGKLDWMAAGLPIEGSLARIPRAGDIARKDVPTCSVDERLGEVRDRVKAEGWDACVVVNEERIVFGLLRAKELDGDEDARIEQVMRPGPSSFRPHVPIEEMAEFMIQHDLVNCPVTTLEGRLVGLLKREDAAQEAMRLHEAHHANEQDEEEGANG